MTKSPTRRSLIGALAGASTLGLAGCLDDGSLADDDSPSLAEEFECESAGRPEPDGPTGDEHFNPVPYPDPPDVDDDQSVEQFVKEYEAALVRNEYVDRYGTNLLRFSYSTIDVELLGRDGRVAFVGLFHSYGGKDDTGHFDELGSGLTYAVDDFGAAKAGGAETDGGMVEGDIPSEDSERHPIENGRLVACFDD